MGPIRTSGFPSRPSIWIEMPRAAAATIRSADIDPADVNQLMLRTADNGTSCCF
jgi:hypothetical protein